MSLFTILFTAALVNNFVLSQFLGICPFLGVSKKVETAAGMGGAVLFVITIASLCTSLLYNFLLVPFELEYLNTIVFILVIAALVQFVEMELKKWFHFSESVVNGVGASVGFLIAIVLMAGIREKLENSNIPEVFKGTPIVLITAGLMAIAFCGFGGVGF